MYSISTSGLVQYFSYVGILSPIALDFDSIYHLRTESTLKF